MNEAELKELQRSIHRGKVERARKMTMAEKFMEVAELSDEAMERMHMGAMWQLGTTDEKEGWAEVRRRLDRQREVRERGRWVYEKPEGR